MQGSGDHFKVDINQAYDEGLRYNQTAARHADEADSQTHQMRAAQSESFFDQTSEAAAAEVAYNVKATYDYNDRLQSTGGSLNFAGDTAGHVLRESVRLFTRG